jgi:hypothetical protein
MAILTKQDEVLVIISRGDDEISLRARTHIACSSDMRDLSNDDDWVVPCSVCEQIHATVWHCAPTTRTAPQ